jgi:F0F1-type ATP synthase epsilon subunit
MENFKLTIRTPEGNLFDKEVSSVSFSAEGGDAQIFAHHASISASILFSTIEVSVEGTEEKILVRNGLFLFNNKENTATLLAIYAEEKSKVSHQTVKEYLKFLEEQLKEGHELSEFQITHLEGEKLAIEQQIQAIS